MSDDTYEVDAETGEVFEKAQTVVFRGALKMTVATLRGEPERAKGLAQGSRVWIADIMGLVRGWKRFPDPKDARRAYRGLTGDFQAQTWRGDLVRSSVLFLPTHYHQAILDTVGEDNRPAPVIEAESPEKLRELEQRMVEELERAKSEEPRIGGNKAVSFKLRLFAMPASGPVGYSYDSDQIAEVSRHDPLMQLMSEARAEFGPPPAGVTLIGGPSDLADGLPIRGVMPGDPD
jgi:hypothetical protein